jgi:ATP-dependent DNA ligase
MAVQFELEGIVAKRAESPYTAGRTHHWQKIKHRQESKENRARRP